MICENCMFNSDCDLERPKEGEKCPYFQPRQRLQITFTEGGMRIE